ncbi:MAG: hypothetical protein GF384_01215 [Elusimicrobia bacterium]|nr:hypothetical protein [Elusimicrobiota bacterium]MBD3411653.1 hypothetical protein [Elusimicrobiota bacterium]
MIKIMCSVLTWYVYYTSSAYAQALHLAIPGSSDLPRHHERMKSTAFQSDIETYFQNQMLAERIVILFNPYTDDMCHGIILAADTAVMYVLSCGHLGIQDDEVNVYYGNRKLLGVLVKVKDEAKGVDLGLIKIPLEKKQTKTLIKKYNPIPIGYLPVNPVLIDVYYVDFRSMHRKRKRSFRKFTIAKTVKAVSRLYRGYAMNIVRVDAQNTTINQHGISGCPLLFKGKLGGMLMQAGTGWRRRYCYANTGRTIVNFLKHSEYGIYRKKFRKALQQPKAVSYRNNSDITQAL